MRIPKDKRPPTPRGDQARPNAKTGAAKAGGASSSSSRSGEAPEKLDVDAALHEELSGRKATAAHLKAIVERVLGAGDDASVQALVKKIASADPANTAPGYRLDNDDD